MVEEFKIKLAQIEDMEDIFNLSNDELVRKNSFNQNKILWENHQNWFNNKIKDNNCIFYVIKDQDNNLISQVRFDKQGDEADISISLSPNFRGKGLASKILKITSEKVINEYSIKKINAYVKIENAVSKIVFEKAGYILKEQDAERIRYELNAK